MQFGSQFVTDILVYAMLLLLGSAIAVSDRARQLALRKSRLEAELVRANLDALRLEIQPHFLFNTPQLDRRADPAQGQLTRRSICCSG